MSIDGYSNIHGQRSHNYGIPFSERPIELYRFLDWYRSLRTQAHGLLTGADRGRGNADT